MRCGLSSKLFDHLLLLLVSAAANRPAKRRGSAHAKYSVSRYMVIKPFLLLGLAGEYRSRRWVWSIVVRRPSKVYDTHRRTKAPSTPAKMSKQHCRMLQLTSRMIHSTKSDVALTLMPFLATTSNEISSFRQNMFNLFWLCRRNFTKNSFKIVAKNSNNVEARFNSVERGLYFTINLLLPFFGNKVERRQSRTLLRHCCWCGPGLIWQRLKRSAVPDIWMMPNPHYELTDRSFSYAFAVCLILISISDSCIVLCCWFANLISRNFVTLSLPA